MAADDYGFTTAEVVDTRSPAERERQARMLADAQADSNGGYREAFERQRKADRKKALGDWWSGELTRRISQFRANPTAFDRLQALKSVLDDYTQAVADGDITPQPH